MFEGVEVFHGWVGSGRKVNEADVDEQEAARFDELLQLDTWHQIRSMGLFFISQADGANQIDVVAETVRLELPRAPDRGVSG